MPTLFERKMRIFDFGILIVGIMLYGSSECSLIFHNSLFLVNQNWTASDEFSWLRHLLESHVLSWQWLHTKGYQNWHQIHYSLLQIRDALKIYLVGWAVAISAWTFGNLRLVNEISQWHYYKNIAMLWAWTSDRRRFRDCLGTLFRRLWMCVKMH